MSNPTCSVEGCEKPRGDSRGMCSMHYSRWRKTGDVGPVEQLRATPWHGSPQTCKVDGCNGVVKARGWCGTHYQRWHQHGDPLIVLRVQKYSGKYSNDARGYQRLRGSRASGAGRVFVHRHLMEQHLGRPLVKGETVHHKNGDRSDNRIENLELWSKAQPSGQRVTDKLAWARDLIALYGPLEDAGLI